MIQKSIKNSVILNSITAVGLVLILLAIIANAIIVEWLEANFDAGLTDKAHLLMTLIEEDEEGIEFEFADEFMPEYELGEQSEYFQLWYGTGEVFERSHSLEEHDLILGAEQARSQAFQDMKLVDGRSGRQLSLDFYPQLEEELRSGNREMSEQKMIVAVARERESLDLLFFKVRGTLLLSIPAVLFLLMLAIKFALEKGLRPLEELKEKLDQLDVGQLSEPIVLDTKSTDLASVVAVVNSSFERISASFKKEKRFSSDAAHELRTPIAELMNMSEVARKWPEKVDHLGFYSDVLKSSEKMHLIVKSLLVLARSKNSQIELELSKFCISKIVTSCWESLSPQAEAKNMTLDSGADEEQSIVSSQVEFYSLVFNLISNAVEYGRKGTSITCLVFENDGLVSFSISNRTDLIDEDDLPHMFDSLWRKDKARSSDSHIGMGLTIVKEYVELLGLDIELILDKDLFTVIVSSIKTSV